MSSDDIAKPRRRTLAEEVFGGPDHAKDTFTTELGAALVAHGGVPSHRLDGFKVETEHGAYNAFDLITSAPMLAFGLRATADAIDAEPWAYENPEERSNRIHQHSMSVEEDARELRQQLRRHDVQPTPPEVKPIAKIKYRINFDPAKLLTANLDDVLDPTCIGMTRPLTIASAKQRAIGKAAVNVCNTYCHLRWGSSVVGCRPGISIGHILKSLQAAIHATSRTYVLAFDIAGFFDTVPMPRAISLARDRLGYDVDSDLGWLLESAVLGLGYYPQSGYLPQGNPMSPLLANLYAAEAIDAEAIQWGPLMRYVDDGLLLCRDAGHAHRAYDAIERHAGPHGLRLATKKTQYVDLRSSTDVLTYLGVNLHVDADLRLHAILPDAAIVKLWHHLGIAVLGRASTTTPAEHALLVVQRRTQIWQGWCYAFGAAEWTPAQIDTVGKILDSYALGGDRLRESFAEAWRDSYAGEAATRAKTAEVFVRRFQQSGIDARLDADGNLDIAAPDIASLRADSAAVFARTKPMGLRWMSSRNGVIRPRWTGPPMTLRAPSLRARLTTNDFGERYADALPALPGEVPFTLGRGSRGNGVLPGAIVT